MLALLLSHSHPLININRLLALQVVQGIIKVSVIDPLWTIDVGTKCHDSQVLG